LTRKRSAVQDRPSLPSMLRKTEAPRDSPLGPLAFQGGFALHLVSKSLAGTFAGTFLESAVGRASLGWASGNYVRSSKSNSATPASRPRRSTPRSPRRRRPGLRTLWRRPFGTRNRIVHLVRVGLDDAPEVPEFRREVLRVLDPLSLEHRVPGQCLAHTIASVTSADVYGRGSNGPPEGLMRVRFPPPAP
jgi:hypothetical protein